MQDVNVVIVFYSRMGSTERLALAAAVGAVQGRANIRLRRLADASDEETIRSVPGWLENRERMNREYVAPRESDALWADAILMGVPAGDESLPAEFERYFDSLRKLRDEGKLRRKMGAAFMQGILAASLCAGMREAGLMVSSPLPLESSDPVEAARLQGRLIADEVRSVLAEAVGSQLPDRNG